MVFSATEELPAGGSSRLGRMQWPRMGMGVSWGAGTANCACPAKVTFTCGTEHPAVLCFSSVTKPSVTLIKG